MLSIPVVKQSGVRQKTHEVKIDYATNWQKLHLRAIETAYGSSPFLEFYIDDILPIYEKKYDSLLALNKACHEAVCNMMDWQLPLTYSSDFITHDDLNQRVDFKKGWRDEKLPPYTQVFYEKKDHISNLSILDLIFNLGPESGIYLKSCGL